MKREERGKRREERDREESRKGMNGIVAGFRLFDLVGGASKNDITFCTLMKTTDGNLPSLISAFDLTRLLTR